MNLDVRRVTTVNVRPFERLEALAAEGLRAAREADTAGVAAALKERAAVLDALARVGPGPDAARVRDALARVRLLDAETGQLLRERSHRLRAELRAFGRGPHGPDRALTGAPDGC